MEFLYIYYLIILSLLVVSDSLRIIENPVDQYSRLNENIQFNCIVEDYQPSVDIIEWCKNDFCTWGRSIELSDGRLKFKSLSRYFIVGNRLNGEWNLLIENVTQSDIGQYKCTVTRREDKLIYKLNSSPANLKIMESPKLIEINPGENIDLVLNSSEEISCIIEKGVPEPNINWILIDSQLIDNLNNKNIKNLKLVDRTNSDFEISSSVLQNSTSFYHINKLKLNATFSLLNKTLICIIEHPLLSEPIFKMIKIDLKYPPILSISHLPEEQLEENKTFTFYCDSNSNPKNNFSSIKMYLADQNSYEFLNLNGVLKLKLTRDMNGKFLVCESSNSVGKSILNYSLSIRYPPRFINTPEPIIIVNSTSRSNLKLNCKVDSNPKSVIYWVKNRQEIVHVGDELVLSSKNLPGEYTCQARLAGFKPILSQSSILTDGLPSIFGDELFFVDSDKDLYILFTVLSSPSYQLGPICVKINQNKSLEDEIILPIKDLNKYNLEINDLNGLKKSTQFKFKIKNPSDSDLGFYNCSISNKYGSSFYSFEIKKKTEGNSLLIFLILTIFFSILFLILILSITILICVKKRNDIKKKNAKSLPNVSDQSGYDKNTKKRTHESSDSSLSNDFEIKQKDYASNTLSDDRKIDSSFKKQSNQISLIIDQNSTETINNQNLSFECLKFPSDTQNLILIENLKPISSTANIYSSNGNYHKANIFSSRFQTNV